MTPEKLMLLFTVVFGVAGIVLNGLIVAFGSGKVFQKVDGIERKVDEVRMDSIRQFDVAHKRIDNIEATQNQHSERLSKVEARCATMHGGQTS
jgi:hypothetical protein